MTNELMPVHLSSQCADMRWGSDALLSADAQGMTIHAGEPLDLGAVQRAARRLDTQGMKQVSLQGTSWSLSVCWAFWQGFRNPKGGQHVQWPALSAADRAELDRRLLNIDWVRDTINLPAENLGPTQLAQRAVDLLCAQACDSIHYRIIKGDDLREQGYMGLHSVGRGSARAPALLELDYNPGGKSDTPVLACLVGKGITFDSGGYSLKQTAFMDAMKSDMGGAALVTGALALAIAQGLQARVKLYLCCADNLVSGNAFKLGDIISYRNGKRVEIMNTDAEGRLVLADGLIDASRQAPRMIIDCATLTGAAKTAVGGDYHALFSFDDALTAALQESATQEDELFWRLPLAEFHRSQLPSAFADLSNVAGAAHSAGASTAAAFLSHFVTDYRQGWLHIDCSATYRKAAVDQWSTGATGIGVRTLARLLLTQAGRC
ncbi:aminopeptidase PepB [Edwardsiella anguillarum]|uniref:aminopeptidase PepB n=1 Tax=Edwardsiella anguillarum TaxID=1821960 RepID=UPI0024B84565|nr:aminopeptidase PepB [Edwardsiella anguillarum]WHP79675.1 aminopeptidase PepB [Edwardsiella anguillarum]WHQ17134.1 aminopeptidase PepB [Edwardsiella anguillarum]WHQ20670.1 aminopeptidase PepB [Edwardsiella anguillarum]WHQ24191.1 aminopeptidase PepB [Edwardsiella anguillarum]WHQ27761.1 aminopeptidase PepB [Edwardsiella anguillarum]